MDSKEAFHQTRVAKAMIFERAISESIERGHYLAFIQLWPDPELIQNLRDLGFGVYRKGIHTCVTWGEVNRPPEPEWATL